MQLAFFSTLTFLTYLFEGFILVAAFDVFFNEARYLLHLGGDGGTSIAVAAQFFAVTIFFVVGHANSTLAHLIFQQILTRFKRLRPSAYFIANAWALHEEKEKCVDSFAKKKSIHRRWVFWKPFGPEESSKICKWIETKYSKERPDWDYDREIFSIGFKKVFSSAKLRDDFQTLITNFNFSRNMLMSLSIIGVLGVTAQLSDTGILTSAENNILHTSAARLGMVDCVEFKQDTQWPVPEQLEDYYEKVLRNAGSVPLSVQSKICKKFEEPNAGILIALFLFVLLLVSVRFFYFFAAISKNVIRYAIREEKKDDSDDSFKVELDRETLRILTQIFSKR